MNLPNILLIMTDQHRFDALGCYGLKAVSTPNIDRLAKEGVLFENCYVNNPVCTPSRASIFTGKPICGHGVYRLHDLFPETEECFTKKLQKVGYETALFGKFHISARVYEMENIHPNSGFDIYEESKTPFILEGSLTEYAHWLRINHPDFYKELSEKKRNIGNFPESVHMSRWVSDRTINYLQTRKQDRPFFCYMSLHDPHDPYNDHPVEAVNEVDEDNMPEPNVIEGESDVKPEGIRREHERGYLGSYHKYSQEDIRQMRIGYYASVSHLDREIGNVLDVLENKGLMDNTMIIFTSDHGDMLGDHELLAKGAFFYDPCTKVPLIMYYPDKLPMNMRINTIVSSHDIAATILTQAGFSKDEIKESMPDSQNLVSLTQNADDSEKARNYAVCQYRGTSICDNKLYWDPPIHATMFRDERYKLNVYHNSSDSDAQMEGELFDMKSDPMERNNLWNDHGHISIKLKLIGRMMNWMVEKDVQYNGSRGGEAFPDRTLWSQNNPL